MKNKSIGLMILTVLYFTFNTVSFAQSPPIVGGYQAASKVDPHVISAAKFAVNVEKQKQGSRISLISIERAERQVVAGVNYKLRLKIKQNGKTRTVSTVVFQDLSRNYSLSHWKIEN